MNLERVYAEQVSRGGLFAHVCPLGSPELKGSLERADLRMVAVPETEVQVIHNMTLGQDSLDEDAAVSELMSIGDELQGIAITKELCEMRSSIKLHWRSQCVGIIAEPSSTKSRTFRGRGSLEPILQEASG